MVTLKSKKAKTSKKKNNAIAKIKFTAEQKKVIKEQLTLAVEEAYLQGKEDGAREQQKITAAREKAIEAAAAKFDKEQKKLEKGISSKKLKAPKNAKSAVKTAKKAAAKKTTKAVKPAVKKTATKAKVKAKKVATKAKKIAPTLTGEAPVKRRGRPAKIKPEVQTPAIESTVEQ